MTGQDDSGVVYVRDSAIAMEKLALARRMERAHEWGKSADVYQEILEKYSRPGRSGGGGRADPRGAALHLGDADRAGVAVQVADRRAGGLSRVDSRRRRRRCWRRREMTG